MEILYSSQCLSCVLKFFKTQVCISYYNLIVTWSFSQMFEMLSPCALEHVQSYWHVCVVCSVLQRVGHFTPLILFSNGFGTILWFKLRVQVSVNQKMSRTCSVFLTTSILPTQFFLLYSNMLMWHCWLSCDLFSI